MTVHSAVLIADLKGLVLRLEDDLRERVQTQPEVLAAWQDEHRRARRRTLGLVERLAVRTRGHSPSRLLARTR